MRIVILGLSITSSWGNGHATTYRALLRALAARGHHLLFLERDVAAEIARGMDGYRAVVVKSTVPVGTSAQVAAILRRGTRHPFSVVSNPEFLKQGDAVNDFLRPERVVIGTDDAKALAIMRELYSPFLRTGHPLIALDVPSAEMTKYVANAFLATKISFMNEMATLCENVAPT